MAVGIEDKWTISHLFVYVCLLYFFFLLVSVFCIFFCKDVFVEQSCILVFVFAIFGIILLLYLTVD